MFFYEILSSQLGVRICARLMGWDLNIPANCRLVTVGWDWYEYTSAEPFGKYKRDGMLRNPGNIGDIS